MKKTKRIALILMTVVLMAVCFVFGASAETWGDYEYTVLEDGTVEITDYIGDDTELVIPEEIDGKIVTVIGEYAFAFCETLIEIRIPDSVEVIDDHGFWGCYNLASVTIPDSVMKIGNKAFDVCERLINATIGKGVRTIGEEPFCNCISLKSISVDIENTAYSSDESGALFDKNKTTLIAYPAGNENTTYVIPDSVTNINASAFSYNYGLESIVIPENVKTVDVQAFLSCYALTKITIANGVKSIKEAAFGLTPFLEEVIVEDMNIELGEYSLCANEFTVSGISRENFIGSYAQYIKSGFDEIYATELKKYMVYQNDIIYTGTIYCHSGSTAEAYAIENGVDYVLTHFFKGDWTYDYDNMIRTRKCIHCDELETEALESTNNGDVEIIEPVDPDTDFDVEEIKGDNFIVVEETVTNGIEGNAEILRAFDITLKNKDGVHVQPDGTVKVKLPLDWTKDGVYKVYRVNDDGSLTDMNAYRQGSHMVFETDHFSIYVIVDVSEKSEADEPETPDAPTEPDTSDCNCICHKEGFIYEILAIVFKFVSKLLGVFPTCDCGIAHY